VTRFLHSADWQLGMTRHFLDEDAQARFTQARIDAVRALGALAAANDCRFAVVAGDVFEHSQLERRTIARALDALGAFAVPVYLLPGNHDPLDAASIYRSDAFVAGKPDHVHVLDTTTPREVAPGVEVVGAPWSSKRPLTDLVGAALADLSPAPGAVRVMVGHGAVDSLSPDAHDPARIILADAEEALDDQRIHFLALGDRHSTTDVGASGRVWYAGAPEPTDFTEVDAGRALVVDLADGGCTVTPHAVGTWCFHDARFELNGSDDLDALAAALDAHPHRERTILRVALQGTLTLTGKARLDGLLDAARAVFAGVDEWERHTDLAVVPDDADFADLDLAGFAAEARDELRAAAETGDDVARDALALLVRLAETRA
jgi:DNA repair exonuclease SbcCD nuclease subunit